VNRTGSHWKWRLDRMAGRRHGGDGREDSKENGVQHGCGGSEESKAGRFDGNVESATPHQTIQEGVEIPEADPKTAQLACRSGQAS
jgi:hypothetical protein